MTDNFDSADDRTKDLLGIEREKAVDKTISTNEQEENLTNIQNSENMEVHHHSHNHGNKNWRSYAWEFVMLFLAVFCGFLAEYFLEHRIEKERGKQYVQSMIEDMASDSTKINEKLLRTTKQALGLDSLSVLFSNPPYNDSTVKKIYILMVRYTQDINEVDFTKRTIAQLRNSGGMRLIPNKTSADEITKYSELVEKVEYQGKYYTKNGIDELIKLNNKIFNTKYSRELYYNNPERLFLKSNEVKLGTNNENLLIEYGNLTFVTSRILGYYSDLLTDVKTQIPKTIAILKKENNLK